MFLLIYFRFTVAIKSAIENNEMMIPGEEETKLQVNENESNLLGLLDEAKCMVTIGGYHTNIVNLQGIILEEDVLSGSITKVWYFYSFICEFDYIKKKPRHPNFSFVVCYFRFP